jgi:hypothetical protein
MNHGLASVRRRKPPTSVRRRKSSASVKRLNRCSNASSTAPGLFRPGNTHGLSAFRALLHLEITSSSPRSHPPMSLGNAETSPRLRRLDPSRQAERTDRSRPARSALLAFSPSEALPLAAGVTVARPLLSRAFRPFSDTPANRSTESEPVHLRVSPCGEPVSRSRPQATLTGTDPSGVSHLFVPRGPVLPLPKERPFRTPNGFGKTLRREPHFRR